MTTTATTDRPARRVDAVVIGAGPAGLQMASHLRSSGVDHVLLEASDRVGAFFATYPRDRYLISFNKPASIVEDPETDLRWDWHSLLADGPAPRFAPHSDRLQPHADELLDYLEAYAKDQRLEVTFGARVVAVERRGPEDLVVHTAGGVRYRARYVVCATGTSRPHVPDISGIEHAEGYEDVSFDARDFAGQRVLILGKGNSGFELAERIIETAAMVHVASPEPVKIAYRTRHAGHVRSHYGRIFDMYQLKLLHALLDGEVQRIERDGDELVVRVDYTHAQGEVDVLRYDRVVRCTGFRFDASILGDQAVTTVHDGRLPAMSPEWESEDVADLYFTGALTQARDYQRAGSTFIDGFRYNVRTLHRLLAERYHDQPYPRDRIDDASPEGLADWTLRRANRTSALWLQFGYLADAIVPGDGGGPATAQRELPLDAVADRFTGHERYFTLTYEFGEPTGDVFAIERKPAAEHAHEAAFLHPVVRCHRGAEVVAVHHVLEDLTGVYHPDMLDGTVVERGGLPVDEYHRRQHVEPLVRFYEEHLRGA